MNSSWKTKKASILFGLTTVSLLSLGVVIGTMPKMHQFFTRAENRSFTLDSTSLPTIENGEGTLTLDAFSHFTYKGATLEEGYHVTLAENGYLLKDEATYGLTTINATFEGSLMFECGYEDDYLTQEVAYAVDLTSGTSAVVDGNYWKLIATSETKITSITISYACNVKSISPGIVEQSGIVSMIDELQFVDIIKEDDTIYLKLKCGYDNTKGRLKTSDLKVQGDNASETFTCDKIETLSSTEFIAYFDVSTKHSSIIGANASKIVYLHLYVGGQKFSSTGNIATTRNLIVTKSMSVSNKRAITIGLRDTGTRLGWLIFEKKNIVDYSTALSNNANIEYGDNPFAEVNGGYSNNRTFATETVAYGTYRYGNTNGKNYKVRVVSNMDVDAKFSLITGGRAGKIFSYNRVGEETDYNPHITSMTLNGSSDGVTPSEVQTTFTQNENWGVWANYKHAEVATLSLKQGVNVIEYTLSTDEQNNLNTAGVSFELDDANAKIALYRDFDINYSPTLRNNNGSLIDTTITTPTGEYNSFITENGGSITGSPQVSANNFKYESGQLYRYGENLGYTFTTTVYAEEAVTAKMAFKVSGRNDRSFSATQASVSSKTNYAYISAMDVNGDSAKATLSTEVYDMTGWTNMIVCDLAEVQLQKGVNTISFTLLGKQSTRANSKLNIRGILFESYIPIRLGA